MKKILTLLCALTAFTVGAESKTENPNLEWFKDAKFGIFIHWGIYGVNGHGASWPVFNGKISQDDYMQQAEKFTAENYDPKAWAKLFKQAGAKYTVLTSKHHDGMALWDTKANDLSVVHKTPAKRDLLAPYAEAIKAEGMKVGFYYSWLDWSNPDYGSLGKMRVTDKTKSKPTDPIAWQRFKDFNSQQIKELTQYKPDLLWWDGDWNIEEKYWGMEQLGKQIKQWAPGVIFNDRIGEFGDYGSAEQGIPFGAREGTWEQCMTMSPGWGYNSKMEKYVHKQIKPNQLIQLLTETVSMGGNLLLNVSPKPDGSIPQWQQDSLKEIGGWLDVNGEAIYGSRAGIHRNHYGSASTLSKDKKTLYLFMFGQQPNQLMVKGLRNIPKKISILGADNAQVTMESAGGAKWVNIPPTRFFNIPQDLNFGYGRVLKIELDEEIDLSTGESGAIEQN